ncbi:MAG: hypothetical protein JW723_05850 [Bacteroidales bacterium]|nr:hypothetical protein [Bacteroidales bacterium]
MLSLTEKVSAEQFNCIKSMRIKASVFILTLFSAFLTALTQDLSFVDQKTGSGTGEFSHQYRTVEPDSADYARAAVAAANLLNATVSKLHTLSNIDEKGIAMNYFDKIITFDNEVLVVKVQHITLTEVSFLYPFNTRIETINRQKISQILYADKKIDLFTPFEEEKKKLLPIQEDRLIVYRRELWERILTTENTKDVSGFEKIGPVSAVFEADQINSSHKYLEKNGIIRLKKKAARFDADIILITSKSVHRGYGDYPNIKIEGIAYRK